MTGERLEEIKAIHPPDITSRPEVITELIAEVEWLKQGIHEGAIIMKRLCEVGDKMDKENEDLLSLLKVHGIPV